VVFGGGLVGYIDCCRWGSCHDGFSLGNLKMLARKGWGGCASVGSCGYLGERVMARGSRYNNYRLSLPRIVHIFLYFIFYIYKTEVYKTGGLGPVDISSH